MCCNLVQNLANEHLKQELKDLFYFLGFTIASVVVVWYLVQGIKAIGNFVVRRKAKKAREAREQGSKAE